MAENANLSNRGPGWQAIATGDLNAVMDLYPSREDVYERGRFGDNVFLFACSLRRSTTLL